MIRVVSLEILNSFQLLLTFTNGEKKIFDVSPYLDKGIFSELKDISYFASARVCNGTVEWSHGQDFCPDTLYEQGILYSESTNFI